MEKELIFYNKIVKVKCSKKAIDIAKKLTAPIVIETQIYFSCMIAKRLVFYSSSPILGVHQIKPCIFKRILNNSQKLTNNIYIKVINVTTKNCLDYKSPPDIVELPIHRKNILVPKWLNIDYNHDIFLGEFGWVCSPIGCSNTKQIHQV